MQEFKFSEAQEGFSEKWALFDPPKQETATVDLENVRYYPKSSIGHSSPIVFMIPPYSAGYLDGERTTMTVTLKIVTDKNEPVKPTDKVGLTNMPLYSIFSQVQLSLGNQEVNPDVNNMYSYKNFIETMLWEGGEVKSTVASAKGYYKDTLGSAGTSDPGSTTQANVGLISRYNLTKDGRTVTFKGNLGVDFLERTGRYLLNGLAVNVTFYQSPDPFRLLAADNTKKYRVSIEDMYITASYKVARGEMLIRHSELLSSGKQAMYAYPRTCLRSHVIPSGVNMFDVSQVISDRVPSLLVVGFVHAESFTGSYTHNAFDFKHFNTTSIHLEVGSRCVPDRPFTPQFASNHFTEEYAAFQAVNGGRGNNISLNEYKDGNTLFCFDVQHHLGGDSSVFPIIKKGNTRLCVKFAENLTNAVVMIIYALTPGFYEVSNSRNVLVHY